MKPAGSTQSDNSMLEDQTPKPSQIERMMNGTFSKQIRALAMVEGPEAFTDQAASRMMKKSPLTEGELRSPSPSSPRRTNHLAASLTPEKPGSPQTSLRFRSDKRIPYSSLMNPWTFCSQKA